MNEWLSKLWDIPSMEYYSAIKKEGLLIHSTTWMNLQGTVSSEKSQFQKALSALVPFLDPSCRDNIKAAQN